MKIHENRKKRILHITQSAGGVETHILLLFKYIDRKKYDCSLVCWTNGTLAEKAAEMGIKVYKVELVRKPNLIKDLKALWHIFKLVKLNRYDIIHTHSGKGGFIGRLAARLAGCKKVIFTPNAFSYLGFKGLKRWVFLSIEKIARNWTTILIATSNSEAFRATYEVNIPKEKVVTINNSIEMKELQDAVAYDSSSEPFILFVGRFDYQKNPEMFIRVAQIIHSRFPDIKFIMLGAGYAAAPYIQKSGLDLKTFSSKLDILEWLPRPKALEIISQSTMLVITSRYESFGYVVAEAMALGKPVIGTKVDGIKDLVVHGSTGFLVEVDDDDQMAYYILKLLKNKELCKGMGEAGWARVNKEFNIERNIKHLERTYGLILLCH